MGFFRDLPCDIAYSTTKYFDKSPTVHKKYKSCLNRKTRCMNKICGLIADKICDLPAV